jgi:hypothetical protein
VCTHVHALFRSQSVAWLIVTPLPLSLGCRLGLWQMVASGLNPEPPLVDPARVLSTLAFSPSLEAVRRLWYYIVECVDVDTLMQQQGYAAMCHCDGGGCGVAGPCTGCGQHCGEGGGGQCVLLYKGGGGIVAI